MSNTNEAILKYFGCPNKYSETGNNEDLLALKWEYQSGKAFLECNFDADYATSTNSGNLKGYLNP